ncbi:hypothetical protein MLD38_027232 [Melastoma candidum]|uniref:Uncharacterized protein n=1 Tax=Melastoma candidum TaxID=119954 RepID=A0ACB9P0V5_9MYRT|nr:hypothetical protein MLD38_027232 [Melastoma candidum]
MGEGSVGGIRDGPHAEDPQQARRTQRGTLFPRISALAPCRLFRHPVVTQVQCEELWSGKAHIPRMSQVDGLSKFAAYSLSVMDGKRTRITKYDLSDHAWEFHFSKAAPEYWRNLDPYWKGTGRPMRRYFHLDGSQSADPGDKVWGGHECCYCTVTSSLEDGKIREHYVRINRWPRLCVSRRQDWSWEMKNYLCSYSSIRDTDKPGGTGPLFPVM